ncbi:MAG TPA: hypothetical protein VHG53_02480 [Candidatus Limnocylindria bacterium]|nr:hypothetical protein [Candidatus Limnocylindria bacterium]
MRTGIEIGFAVILAVAGYAYGSMQGLNGMQFATGQGNGTVGLYSASSDFRVLGIETSDHVIHYIQIR